MLFNSLGLSLSFGHGFTYNSYHGLWYKNIPRLREYRKLAQISWNTSGMQGLLGPTENKHQHKVKYIS